MSNIEQRIVCVESVSITMALISDTQGNTYFITDYPAPFPIECGDIVVLQRDRNSKSFIAESSHSPWRHDTMKGYWTIVEDE